MAVNIRLEKLVLGMVLAQSVKDRNGRVLLTAGQVINENNLKILKAWGITDVMVDIKAESIADAPPLMKVDPSKMGKDELALRDLFRNTDMRHPAVRELFNLCLAQKTRGPQGSGDTRK